MKIHYPKELKYTKDHEWAKLDDHGIIATIGITDHAQSSLGDIVYVELPKVGKELKVGEAFGVVESIKAVSDLFAPLEGKVIEVNSNLIDEPSEINKDPHHGAWMIKLEIKDPHTVSKLMDSDSYQKFVESIG